MSRHDKKLDQAARAAWLYYVAGKTQNEIADIIGVSRQAAQRLVALASEQQIVTVSISHPIADCMDLAFRLQKRFGLAECHVVPSGGLDEDSVSRMIAVSCAEVMAQYLRQEEPQIVAVGSGRMLRSSIDALPELDRPQHVCVSLIGAIASDGSCTRYDVPLRMAEKTQGKYFILPAPMFADSKEDGELWRSHRLYRAVIDKSEQADVAFIGIGQVNENCPLCEDGFISAEQLAMLQQANVVAEVLGHFLADDGSRVDCELNPRLTSGLLQPQTHKNIIAFAGGKEKHRAIRAVLNGSWISGLVTDEDTANYLLSAG